MNNKQNLLEVPFQNIEVGFSTVRYVDKVVDFLEMYLPEFFVYFSSMNVSAPSEEDISEILYLFLQRKRRFNNLNIEYPFEFQPETSQRPKQTKDRKKGFKRRVDLGVRINTYDVDMELVYCLEAKKLPTDRSGGEREKEYVVGNQGAINRYKLNLHGISKDGGLINRNGVVGYIQSLDVNHWHTVINDWIKRDTNWGESEMLKISYNSTIAKLESMHTRITGETLILNHFWILMC